MKNDIKIKFCKKCNKILGDSDKYCTHCGNETIDKPLRDVSYVSELVYGPPYSVKHVCGNCGQVYIESGLGRPSVCYCPKCGAKYKDS